MTNDELKALCLRVECSSFERDVAESILRLLAQCDAMRDFIDEIRETHDCVAHYKCASDALKKLDAALSQLGERT